MTRSDRDKAVSAIRALAERLSGLRCLARGQVPSRGWRDQIVGYLKVRFVSRDPATRGSHALHAISLNIGPNDDAADVAETLIHEIVHAAMMGDALEGRIPKGEDPHGARFWAYMTLAAEEAWGLTGDVINGDGVLAERLRDARVNPLARVQG